MPRKSYLGRLFFLALLAGTPSLVQAELRPAEIAIIAVRGSRESERLAEYYAEKRGVPTENICTVVMPRGETLSHEKWQWAVRPEIRKWLQDHDPQGKLRCLVTTWDVPLRIGKDKKDSPSLHHYQSFLAGELAKRLMVLHGIAKEFGSLAPGILLTSEEDDTLNALGTASTGGSGKSEIDKLQQQIEKELQRALARIRKVSDPKEKKIAADKVQKFATAIGGARVLLESLQRQLKSDSEQATKQNVDFERLRGMFIAYAQVQKQLEQQAPSIERDTIMLDVLTQASGLLSSAKWVEEQLKIVAKNETVASFDSELSLVMWPDDYQLLRWQPNYLRPMYDHSQLRETYRTLMVARIDGPTLRIAKGLIDTALKVEAEGLQGKVYLDSRGIGKLDGKPVAPGGYPDYDNALLVTAQGLQEQTSLEVVLNKDPELFQAGDCPDAALYCGWYSLAKYVDAFDWAPGAIAYHLASSEATTLRKEGSQVWCKRLLEDGVCVTLGPVAEPYLAAFPRPNEFFAMLIRGDLSLVECYYRTKPYNSWMMTLVGDPLYRPYANHKVLK